jgi:hypothetical protein
LRASAQRAIVSLLLQSRSIGITHVAGIFVSNTGSDREWAYWIAVELLALDHTHHVH